MENDDTTLEAAGLKSEWYRLDADKNAVPCRTLGEMRIAFEIDNRKVDRTEIGNVSVSTVFLSLNHAYDGEPMLFETMIFGGLLDQHQVRCSTWAQAIDQHAAAVRKVRWYNRWFVKLWYRILNRRPNY